MDHQTYPTKDAALSEINGMRGWPDARAIQLYLPDDDHADQDGNAWVVEAESDKYLRTDGYVR